MQTDLSKYDNSWYNPGAGSFKRICWYIVNATFFNSGLLPLSSLKVNILRGFGAEIGEGVNIKPYVNIKHPWLLKIGNHVWIGEGCWIDNLAKVSIGDHACISQGALLLTGNHDFSKPTFNLIVKEIHIQTGAWIGARSVVCPGVTCGSHSVLCVGSVATKNLEAYGIYQGNPAEKVKLRQIENPA